jgi:hypothetical protein
VSDSLKIHIISLSCYDTDLLLRSFDSISRLGHTVVKVLLSGSPVVLALDSSVDKIRILLQLTRQQLQYFLHGLITTLGLMSGGLSRRILTKFPKFSSIFLVTKL